MRTWFLSTFLDPLVALPNETRLSCGALKKDSFLNLRAPQAASALLGGCAYQG